MLTTETRELAMLKIENALEDAGYTKSLQAGVPIFKKPFYLNDFNKEEITYLIEANVNIRFSTDNAKETTCFYMLRLHCSYFYSENRISATHDFFVFKQEDLDDLNAEIEKGHSTIFTIFDAIGRPGAVQMNALGDRN